MNLKDVNVLKILKQKYVIVTKYFPLEFDDGNGNRLDSIEDARLYNDMEDANNVLQYFDDPDEYQIIQVSVIYEF